MECVITRLTESLQVASHKSQSKTTGAREIVQQGRASVFQAASPGRKSQPPHSSRWTNVLHEHEHVGSHFQARRDSSTALTRAGFTIVPLCALP